MTLTNIAMCLLYKVLFIIFVLACNAVGLFDNGILTMKNYGMRRNCTTAIIYPESVHLLNVDVGVTSDKKPFEAEVGISDKVCLN